MSKEHPRSRPLLQAMRQSLLNIQRAWKFRRPRKRFLPSRSYLIIAYLRFVDGYKFGKDDLGALDAVQAEEQMLATADSCVSRWCLRGNDL